MDNLVIKLRVEIMARPNETDDPEEAGEQEVKQTKQEIESSDRRHQACPLSS